jgi:hypothetical protein
MSDKKSATHSKEFVGFLQTQIANQRSALPALIFKGFLY